MNTLYLKILARYRELGNEYIKVGTQEGYESRHAQILWERLRKCGDDLSKIEDLMERYDN